MLTIHQYNNRKADIERRAQAALDGLRKRADSEKLSADDIIARASEIGRRQAQDMAQLERDLQVSELPAININENVRLKLISASRGW